MDTDTILLDKVSELPLTQNALHIAMRTMRERCYLLQNRLRAVEDENIQLSIKCDKSKMKTDYSNAEVKMLHANVAQLTKEKAQLAHHVFMVSRENKKMWLRLAKLTNSTSQEDLALDLIDDKINPTNNTSTPLKESSFTVPHLIRSQTFTQNSPNPKLKAKVEEGNEKLEASLEEISLKVITSFLAEKSELVQQYQQMVQLQMDDDKYFNLGSIGFPFIDDFSNGSLLNIKNQTEKLIDLKKIALQQQEDMKICLSNLETYQAETTCLNCSKHNQVEENTTNERRNNEGLDTSEIELPDSLTKWATPANSTSYHDDTGETSPVSHLGNKQNTASDTTNHIINNKNGDVFNARPLFNKVPKEEQKLGTTEKICPMCGDRFQNMIAFDKFQEHVEGHFIGDEDFDSIADNYEVVTRSVGNNFN